MYSVIVTLIVIAAVLMCGIVLMQESKGGGLASSFSNYNAIMGVRGTTNFIEKLTWGLAIVMVVLSIVSTAFLPNAEQKESVINNIEAPAATSADNLPAIPAPAAEAE